MKACAIFTDGSYSRKHSVGGWGAVLITNIDSLVEISGGLQTSTSNRAEMIAAIKALEYLKESYRVCLFSDSSYLLHAFVRGRIKSWEEMAMNVDLWKVLLGLNAKHNITWIKVRGHSGDHFNERCDVLATAETRKAIQQTCKI